MSAVHPSPEVVRARRLELAHAWRGVRYAEAYGRLHPESAPAVYPVAGGYAVYVGPGSPLNRAIGLGFEGPVRQAEIDALLDFYACRQSAARIDVCPLADVSLFDAVRAAGFHLESFFSMLYRPLDDRDRSPALPEGIHIAQAGPEEAGAWLRAVAQGFEETDEPSAAAFDILGPNFHAADSAAFCAWIGGGKSAGRTGGRKAVGELAGGGGMYLHDGVVELGGASTRRPYRRQGVQTALIAARLAAARAAGCDLAMVLTEPGSHSQHNLERCGFHLAYTRVVMVREFPQIHYHY